MTAVLSAAAIILYLRSRTKPRKSLMLAMLLSSAGDVFMVNSSRWGQLATYAGAAFFIAAHLTYADGFFSQLKGKGLPAKNTGTYAGIAAMGLSAVGLGIAAFTIPDKPKPVMFALILLYIAAIGCNVTSTFSLAKAFGKTYRLLPCAAVVFYVTDIFIFADMLDIDHSLRQFVWLAYPEAQLILQLFGTGPLKRSAGQTIS